MQRFSDVLHAGIGPDKTQIGGYSVVKSAIRSHV